MSTLCIKKSEARSEYGGWASWFRNKMDLPESVELQAKDGGMYGNRDVIVTFPDGEIFEFSGYFSSGISPHYKVRIPHKKGEALEEKLEAMEAKSESSWWSG